MKKNRYATIRKAMQKAPRILVENRDERVMISNGYMLLTIPEYCYNSDMWKKDGLVFPYLKSGECSVYDAKTKQSIITREPLVSNAASKMSSDGLEDLTRTGFSFTNSYGTCDLFLLGNEAYCLNAAYVDAADSLGISLCAASTLSPAFGHNGFDELMVMPVRNDSFVRHWKQTAAILA